MKLIAPTCSHTYLKVASACLQAKLYETPHSRREHQREGIRQARDAEEPTEFMERIAFARENAQH